MAVNHGLLNRFKSTLRQLDYADTVSERDLHSVLSHPKCAVLLEWLCDNLSAENTLADEELERFESLKARQNVLEGDALRETLAEIREACPSQDLSDDELRQSVASLEEQASTLLGAKQHLQDQHAVLSEQLRNSNRRLEQIRLLGQKVAEEGKSQLSATRQQNKQLNIQLEELMQTSTAIITAAGAASSSQSTSSSSQSTSSSSSSSSQSTRSQSVVAGVDCSGLLSCLDLTALQGKEEVFLRKLTEHTKKQFKGIKNLDDSGEECHLVDTRDPQYILMDGESSSTVAEACEELVRLRSIYVTSQMQLHCAETSVASVTAASAMLEKKLAMARSQQSSSSWPSNDGDLLLRSQLEEAEKAVDQLRREIQSLKYSDMQAALTDLASVQDTHVLGGNYQLKLARQRYFLGKQTELIEHLLGQRARLELLAMMLEIEERQHRQSEQLLGSLQAELDACCKRFLSTQGVSRNPCLQRPDPDRRTVDSQDSTMLRLSALLALHTESDTNGTAFITTYQHIQQQADALSHAISSHLSKLSSVRESHAGLVSTLENSVRSCDQAVASTGVENGLPTMRVQELRKGMTNLEELVSILQRSVKDCLQQWSEKTKLLAADEVELKGRNLFAWFFTDPLKVELCIQHLREQVQH